MAEGLYLGNAIKQLLEVGLHAVGSTGFGQHVQQLVIGQEEEPREVHTLLLQIAQQARVHLLQGRMGIPQALQHTCSVNKETQQKPRGERSQGDNKGTVGRCQSFTAYTPGMFATLVHRGSLTAVDTMERHTASTASNLIASAGIWAFRSTEVKMRSDTNMGEGGGRGRGGFGGRLPVAFVR
jgi:hypothetical protein